MTRRAAIRAALSGLAIASASAVTILILGPWSRADAELDDVILSRAIVYRIMDPDLSMEEAVDLVHASDEWQARASERGKSLSEMLAETSVTEGEAKAWYEAHRHLFGPRPFDDVRGSVMRMARLEKLRATMEREH